MEKTDNKNALVLKGRVVAEPKMVRDSSFYEFELAIERASGTIDKIMVIFDRAKFDESVFDMIRIGENIGIMGKIVVYYDFRGKNMRPKHNVRALATTIGTMEELPEYFNEVYIEGTLSRNPVLRTTPIMEKQITDFVVTVISSGHTNYVPCIAWGKAAKWMSKRKNGDFASVVGRFQSREYNKLLDDGTLEVRTAYDISTIRIETFDKE